MTILPIVSLHAVVLFAVYDITAVMFHQVVPIDAVFVSVPVVIIMVVPVIDSDLDLLRLAFNRNEGWGGSAARTTERM